MSKWPMIAKERVITQVTPVAGEFLLVQWDKSQIGLVDMRPMLANLPVFEFLRDGDAFASVKAADDGSAVYWIDYEGDIVDIDSASLWLRRKAIAPTTPKSPLRTALNPTEIEKERAGT